jgi:Leucine-rich repeat (LRR) protein
VPRLTSPERISQLNFSFGDIRAVPAHIVSASNLQILDLSHNKISKIEYVCAITSLKFINLSYNLISQLPNDLLHLAEI